MGTGGTWTPEIVDRFARWVLIDANRMLMAAVIVAGVFVLTEALLYGGVIAVGPESTVKTLFGSGVTSGLFTLITVALTINQLISSRVFGSPNKFKEEFEGSREVRRTVERVAEQPTSPTGIVEFIAFVGDALGERADRLAANRESELQGDEADRYLTALEEFAERIGSVSTSMSPVTVITTLAGSRYADCIQATEDLLADDGDRAAASARDDLTAIDDLLRVVSIVRQYYKTIAIQQELGRLSHQLIFAGLPALLVAIYTPLLYTTAPATTIPSVRLPVVVSGATAVALLPLALLLSHLLRITTIMRYTVSVGPFEPPEHWSRAE